MLKTIYFRNRKNGPGIYKGLNSVARESLFCLKKTLVSSFTETIDLACCILVTKSVKTYQEKYSFRCWDAIHRIVLSLKKALCRFSSI